MALWCYGCFLFRFVPYLYLVLKRLFFLTDLVPRLVYKVYKMEHYKTRLNTLACYTISEILEKYSISETALHNLIKRENIPRIKKGWYAYMPKTEIHKHLGAYE